MRNGHRPVPATPAGRRRDGPHPSTRCRAYARSVGLLVGTAGFGVDVGVGSPCIKPLSSCSSHRSATGRRPTGSLCPGVLLVRDAHLHGVLEQNGTPGVARERAAAGSGSPR
ncbi:hypothetical protein HBB16_19655 [Pseudonocardia sp. MCCB 268]|nr:hypothetical protein [Pseudonocardia cytotoxica]